jgi:hypothetical protein
LPVNCANLLLLDLAQQKIRKKRNLLEPKVFSFASVLIEARNRNGRQHYNKSQCLLGVFYVY